MITVDTANYFAKAGLPGNPWRTPHLTRSEAIRQARYFVRSWMENGLDTFAVVFYRTGEVVQTVTAADLRAEADAMDTTVVQSLQSQ